LNLEAIRAHYLSAFGESTGERTFESDGRGVDVLRYKAPDAGPGDHVYATLGGAQYPLPGASAAHRLEFYAQLIPDVPNIGRVLATLAMYPERELVALSDSHSVDIQRPVSQFSEMHQVLLFRPSVEFLAPLELRGGEFHIEFLEVVPVYESEVQYKREHGMGALFDMWEGKRVEFWNPGRPDSVGPAQDL
jgi:hypothetical protein